MSEYWKSNPRKYCDFCKCWIADNRPSIEFHERGKKHKENVEKKLDVIAKKGKEDHKNKLLEDDYMKAMEKAALLAYKKDLETNPDMTGTEITKIAQATNAKIVIGSEANCSNKSEPKQEINSVDKVKIKKNNKSMQKLKSKKKEQKPKQTPMEFGPVNRGQPYGSWKTAFEPIVQPVDLQLPTLPEQEFTAPEISFKRPKITFEEKTVTLSNDSSTVSSGPITFKKRKGGDEHKKNVRKRLDD